MGMQQERVFRPGDRTTGVIRIVNTGSAPKTFAIELTSGVGLPLIGFSSEKAPLVLLTSPVPAGEETTVRIPFTLPQQEGRKIFRVRVGETGPTGQITNELDTQVFSNLARVEALPVAGEAPLPGELPIDIGVPRPSVPEDLVAVLSNPTVIKGQAYSPVVQISNLALGGQSITVTRVSVLAIWATGGENLGETSRSTQVIQPGRFTTVTLDQKVVSDRVGEGQITYRVNVRTTELGSLQFTGPLFVAAGAVPEVDAARRLGGLTVGEVLAASVIAAPEEDAAAALGGLTVEEVLAASRTGAPEAPAPRPGDLRVRLVELFPSTVVPDQRTQLVVQIENTSERDFRGDVVITFDERPIVSQSNWPFAAGKTQQFAGNVDTTGFQPGAFLFPVQTTVESDGVQILDNVRALSLTVSPPTGVAGPTQAEVELAAEILEPTSAGLLAGQLTLTTQAPSVAIPVRAGETTRPFPINFRRAEIDLPADPQITVGLRIQDFAGNTVERLNDQFFIARREGESGIQVQWTVPPGTNPKKFGIRVDASDPNTRGSQGNLVSQLIFPVWEVTVLTAAEEFAETGF